MNLGTHMTSSFECELCHDTFETKKELLKHYKTHRNGDEHSVEDKSKQNALSSPLLGMPPSSALSGSCSLGGGCI
jgi:hypothetical protein